MSFQTPMTQGPYAQPQISYDPFGYGNQPQNVMIYNDPGLWQHCTSVEIENYRLRSQLNRAELCEDAYRDFYADSSGYHAKGKYGKYIRFTDVIVKQAVHIIPDKMCDIDSYYLLYLDRGNLAPLRLTESDYLHDKTLIIAIQAHSKTAVRKAPTMKNSADLLRKIIATMLIEVHTPFRAGWCIINEQPRFMQYAHRFSSHQQSDALLSVAYLDENYASPVFSNCATELISSPFRRIKNAQVRGLLFLMQHIAFLFSLLSQLGYQVPIGLCICCSTARTEEWCKDLFSLYGDQPISLDSPHSAFSRALIARKDQSAVILDHRNTRSADKNTYLLVQAIASGYIDDARVGLTVLAALPVVISRSATDLSCSPLFMSINIADADIDWEEGITPMENCSEYFASFASYSETHISEMKAALCKGKSWAFGKAEDLTSEGTAMLSCLYGMWTFIKLTSL